MRISDWSSDVCSSDLFRQIEAGQFLAVGVVENACIGVRDRTEVLAAFDAFVDRHSNNDLFDVGAELCKIDLDRLVVTCARTGAIVTAVDHRAVRGRFVVVENEVRVAQNLVVGTEDASRSVKVESSAIGQPDIPAKAYGHGGYVGDFLRQRDVGALAK